MLIDNEIVGQLIDYPEEGLENLMNQYTGYVYAIVHGKLSQICNKQDIEECVSDIFCEFYKVRNRIDLKKGESGKLRLKVEEPLYYEYTLAFGR